MLSAISGESARGEFSNRYDEVSRNLKINLQGEQEDTVRSIGRHGLGRSLWVCDRFNLKRTLTTAVSRSNKGRNVVRSRRGAEQKRAREMRRTHLPSLPKKPSRPKEQGHDTGDAVPENPSSQAASSCVWQGDSQGRQEGAGKRTPSGYCRQVPRYQGRRRTANVLKDLDS